MQTPPVDHVVIVAADGARATITLDGAHVTSWIPSGDETDQLFVSARSGFGPGVSIRGGIPIIFPQFGADGPLQRHGFARNRRWTPEVQRSGDDEAVAQFALHDDDATRAIWPHSFRAVLTVRITRRQIAVALDITNASDDVATFTAALHPYFAVHDAFATRVHGLAGLRYRDALRARSMHTEDSPSLAITGDIDRVYFDVAGAVEVVGPQHALRIEQSGFSDVVVWNPGGAGTRGRADFESGEERRMLCVEAAAVQHPISLAPGSRWKGEQVISALRLASADA